MWKHHLAIIAVLVALIPLVYLLDHHLLRSRGDIFLVNLSGLLLSFYLLWLAVQIPLSSAALYLLGTGRLYTVHGVSAAASVALVLLGYAIVSQIDSARSKARYEARMAARQDLFDAIILESWWRSPDGAKPDSIGAVVRFEHSGRFAASVQGRTARPDNRGVYNGEMKPQKQVEAGDRIVYEFPLKYYSDDAAPNVVFSFMLFRDRSGSAPEDIIKQYAAAPERADDGERFYAALPPPAAGPPRSDQRETGTRE